MSDDVEDLNDLTISDSSTNDVSEKNNDPIPSSSSGKTSTINARNSQNAHMLLTPLRKRKTPINLNMENYLPITPGAPNIESFANEVMINIFKFLPRSDLDRCVFVNRRWNHIIHIYEQHFSRRCIEKLSVYADFNPHLINFWACSLASGIQTQRILDLRDNDGFSDIVQNLKYSKIKCLVLGTIHLTEDIIEQLLSILRNADTIVLELQMRRVGLENITAQVFHEFCEMVDAERFGFTDMLRVHIEHFGNEFFNKKIFREAKYLLIQDTKSDVEVVPVNVDDDTLIDFIFGENIASFERKVACIEFPAISEQFVTKVINKFKTQSDISHMVTEAALMSCVRQTVLHYPQYQNIILRYANYESYNATANKELRAEVKMDDRGSVNVFLSVGERY